MAGVAQPSDGQLAPSALLECTIYKATRLQSDLVVKRRLRVYHDKLQTFHDFTKNPKDHKTWYLDRACKLEPDTADEISQQRKVVRPPGTWTVTASVLPGSGQPVDLYCFSVAWPSSWLATKGYSTFHMGFDTKEEAVRVFSCLQQQLSMLQMRASSTRSDAQHLPHSHKSSYDGFSSMNGAFDDASAMNKSAAARQVRPGNLTVQHWSTDGSSAQGGSGDGPSSPFARAAANRRTFDEDWQDAEDSSDAGSSGEQQWNEFASSYEGSDEASSSDAENSDAAQPAERWVPYRHTNGVAIYFQRTHDDAPGACAMGSGSMCPSSSGSSEYMASSIVRGSPDECLAVLLDPSSHTTILGPASRIDVIESGQDRQVLRLTVEATGMTRRLCAPRQVVVERVFKREDAGIHVVLFSSIDDTPGQQQQQQQQRRGRGGWLAWPSWYRPVRATVRGGYTISPREDAEGAAPECLVTCILKVDLGGTCGEGSWLRPFADAMGWVDAYVERMLMAVILVKDEVEQRRFLVQPYSMFGDEPKAAKKQRRRRRQQHAVEGEDQQPDGLAEGGADVSGSGHGRVDSRGGSRAGVRRDQGVGDGVGGSEGGEAAGAREARERHHRGMMSARALRSSGSRKRSVTSGGAPSPTRGSQSNARPAGTLGIVPGSLSLLEQRFWSELHAPGGPAPFKVRGASYLSDKRKVPAGVPEFVLSSVDLVITDKPTQHISRFLPSVRKNGAPFSFVVNLIIPGTPVLSLVGVFVNENHPSILGPAPPTAAEAYSSGWQPFDYALHRFLNASDADRSIMFKLIPHIADGSWVIKQSVGTVPLIVGTKLQTTYHSMPSYFEVSVDVSSSSAAAYITGMVRGTTKSLVIDIGFLLEGQSEGELPESLIGAFRLHHLDLSCAKPVDTSQELPLPPGPPPVVAAAEGGRQEEGAERGRVSAKAPRSMTTHSRNRSGASIDEMLLLNSTAPPSLQLTPLSSITQRRSSQEAGVTSSSRTPPASHTPAGALTPNGMQTPGKRSPPLTASNSGALAATPAAAAAAGSSPRAAPAGAATAGSGSEQREPSSSTASLKSASSSARKSHRRSSSSAANGEAARQTPSTATSAPKQNALSPSGSSSDLTKVSAAVCIARAHANASAAAAAAAAPAGVASQPGTATQGRASATSAAATAAGAVAAAEARQQRQPQLRQRLSLESPLSLPTFTNMLPPSPAHTPGMLVSSPPNMLSQSPNLAGSPTGGGAWAATATPPRHSKGHYRHKSMGSASEHPKLTALEQIRQAEASLRSGHSAGGAFAGSETVLE